MTKKHLKLIIIAVLVATLALIVSGCGRPEQSLEGKNIVTFELQGGTLQYGTASTNTKINYAYEPGTFILDPAKLNNYSLMRTGYDFTGWYKSAECNPSEKWDFENETINTETLTLYAGWRESIVYSFTVYYMDGETPVKLGTYEVEEGAVFEDWRNYAANRPDHTPIAYYSDPSLTTPWDFTTVHPGGGVNKDIPVYADYIEGVWELVDSYSALNSALKGNKNVYLTANVDCGGKSLYSGAYSSVFNGRNFTVSNFKVEEFGTSINPSVAIFKALGEGAEIKDVSFTDVVYDFSEVSDKAKSYKAAPLAISADGAKVTNVTVTGKILSGCGEDKLTRLSEAFYEDGGENTVEGFTATVTVEEVS